ncbi:MAG: hypothetical protein GXO22_02375 [Aquificae bacterium]|nr:hypothetical protein [Aquificota bacterium]
MKKTLLFIYVSLLCLYRYVYAVNIEIGIGQTNLNIDGKVTLEQENMTLNSQSSPSVKHFYINLEFPGTLIPSFKFEYISHTHEGTASLDAKLPIVIKEIPLSSLYTTFYPLFERSTKLIKADFYKDIKIGAVDVKQETKAYEYDYILYYKFYLSDYLVPKLGVAIKDLKVRTRYTIKAPLFSFKTSDEISFNKTIPLVYYGLEVYIPLIPRILTVEWNTEGKEIYANENFVLDLKSMVKFRFLSYVYLKNVYLALGYRHWRLDTKTTSKKAKQDIHEDYRWYGFFTEIGMMF